MNTNIATERCLLTMPSGSDRSDFVRLSTNSEVRRYLGGAKSPYDAERQFEAMLGAKAPRWYWIVSRRNDGAFLGVVSLTPHHDGLNTEVSYEFLPEYWGIGYATEAVNVVLKYAAEVLKLPCIVAETQTANSASRRLLERLGMKLERTLQRFQSEQAIYRTSQ